MWLIKLLACAWNELTRFWLERIYYFDRFLQTGWSNRFNDEYNHPPTHPHIHIHFRVDINCWHIFIATCFYYPMQSHSYEYVMFWIQFESFCVCVCVWVFAHALIILHKRCYSSVCIKYVCRLLQLISVHFLLIPTNIWILHIFKHQPIQKARYSLSPFIYSPINYLFVLLISLLHTHYTIFFFFFTIFFSFWYSTKNAQSHVAAMVAASAASYSSVNQYGNRSIMWRYLNSCSSCDSSSSSSFQRQNSMRASNRLHHYHHHHHQQQYHHVRRPAIRHNKRCTFASTTTAITDSGRIQAETEVTEPNTALSLACGSNNGSSINNRNINSENSDS